MTLADQFEYQCNLHLKDGIWDVQFYATLQLLTHVKYYFSNQK